MRAYLLGRWTYWANPDRLPNTSGVQEFLLRSCSNAQRIRSIASWASRVSESPLYLQILPKRDTEVV